MNMAPANAIKKKKKKKGERVNMDKTSDKTRKF